jgi:RNA:NAD 2'-phosphotransferase (TPT1/KptA family)
MSRRFGRGGRGGGRAMPREEQLSRGLSKLLRHTAKSEGLYIFDDGYINLDHVVSAFVDGDLLTE